MPNIKSAVKRVSVTEKKTFVNKIQKSGIRSTLKKAKTVVAEKAENAMSQVVLAQKSLDKAVAKGYMHKNTAARHKSRLTKALNALNAQ